MSVSLEAIKFNHDPMSAIHDALNIRKNETEFINVPEWRRGVSVRPEDSLAAYAKAETLGNTITIQAKFKCPDPAIKEIQIRSIDPAKDLALIETSDPFRLIESLFKSASPQKNILGEVKARSVRLRNDGETDFHMFELQNGALGQAQVGTHDVSWVWQFRLKASEPWTSFAESRHRIYTVLNVPKSPWRQLPFEEFNLQLPWSDVLDHACAWARGARTIDESASQITHAVFNLGSSLVRYDPASCYADMSFDCASFLSLLRDDRGMGQVVNCEDCATIVSTFGNILGCDLWQSKLGLYFDTNHIRLIGGRNWEVKEFSYHEVAWKGACTRDYELFDSCLQVDGDDDPTTPCYQALLATPLRFGEVADKQYRFRLAVLPGQNDLCYPRPDTRQRRSIGIKTGAPLLPAATGSASSSPHQQGPWHDYFNGLKNVNEWYLYRTRPVLNPRFVFAIRSLWYVPEGDPERLMRLDVYELKSPLNPQSEVQRLRARYTEDPQTQTSQIDRSPATAMATAFVFALGQYVVEVRSVGRKPTDVGNVVTYLRGQLLANAADGSVEKASP